MRRTWLGRALAAFVAVWLVLSMSEPAFLHACPVHAAHGGSPHAGMAGHAVSQHDAHRSDSHPQGDQNSCTCLGQSCASSAVAMHAPAISFFAATSSATRDGGLPDYQYVPVAAEHVLPFQNGPPARV